MRASETVIVNSFVIKGLERISPLHHQITEAISEEAWRVILINYRTFFVDRLENRIKVI